MNTAVYDHLIFSQQVFGGVSRYFCEIAVRIPQRSAWRTKVVAPVHYNPFLARSKVTTFGVFLALPHPRLKRLYAWGNRLVAQPLMSLNPGTILHHTYFSPRPFVSKAPNVVTVHDMIHELYPDSFSSRDPTREWKRANIRDADHVICVSHSTSRDLQRILSVPPEKISVVHLGYSHSFTAVDPGSDSNAGSEERPFFLYVGARTGYKNFRGLLEVFASSRQLAGQFDLIAFGGGSFNKAELARIRELGLSIDAVRQVSGNDQVLANHYRRARAFVYPSEYEGFGIPPLEAMSCGCPVACSHGSSLPEVVGAAAELFDPKSVDSMRSALERLAFDDVRRRELIKAGHQQCTTFSWDRCADETVLVYDSLV